MSNGMLAFERGAKSDAKARMVREIAMIDIRRGVRGLGDAFEIPRAAPAGATDAQIPLLNRILGGTICPTMNCGTVNITQTVPTYTPGPGGGNSSGTHEVVVGTSSGPCEPFWRLDRPRSYIVVAAIAALGYGAYRLARKR